MRNGPRLSWASALTVGCHTSLCVHSHPQRKEKAAMGSLEGLNPPFPLASGSPVRFAQRTNLLILFLILTMTLN